MLCIVFSRAFFQVAKTRYDIGKIWGRLTDFYTILFLFSPFLVPLSTFLKRDQGGL